MSPLARLAAEERSAADLRAQAMALFKGSDFIKSLAAFDGYLAQFPQDPDMLNYKGRALESLGCFDEALACLDRALDQVPRHVPILIKRAHVLFQLGRPAAALESAERAVSAGVRHLDALNTRGMILDELGRPEEALADFEQILAIDPDYADAITNCGVHHGRAGNFEQALDCYERSLSIKPDQINALYNRSVIRLVLGDWSRGFAEFETRWKLFPHEAARLSRLAPRWQGEPGIARKTILLHHEQGYGDTLQFSRYASLVAERGANVVLAVPTALRRLMMTLPGSPHIVSEGDRTPAHDFHCPLMSLPLVFGTTPSSVPAPIPYLRADPRDIARWSERLGERHRPRIGLAWCGRRFPPINHARDMTLEAIRPLFALDADFICLQTDISEPERRALASLSNGILLKERFEDFADTAALVANLDLIITVDTAIAHLAGALGKPVWVMNRYASCWRWLLDRPESPWYPTLRLFRQPQLDDWGAVVREVLLAGAAFVLEQSPGPSQATPAADVGRKVQELAVLLQSALDQHHAGRLKEAVIAYQGILESFPDQFDTLHYLGVALAQLQQFEEALKPLTRASSLRPYNAVVHNHTGNALAGLGRHADAIQCYERAIACDGGYADSHYNRGIALMALGQPEAAAASHTEASRLNPEHAQAYNNRGVVFSDLGRLDEALSDYDRAIKIRPEFVDAWVNRSDVLRRLRRFEEALDSSTRAIQLNDQHGEAHNGHGAILADLGQYEEALASYDRAIKVNPTSAEAIWNKGLVELSRGNFRDGLKHYESRWGVKSLKLKKRFEHIAPWNGEATIAGKVVLLHAEQGYGDTIQFSRYCAAVAERGARVVLSTPSVLTTLLGSLKGVEAVIDQAGAPHFDVHCPLLSLPLALGTELAHIPAAARYLKAEPTARARWAARLNRCGDVPKIGLVWSGRSTHNKDRERSMAFKTLIPILKRDIQWVSLQKEVRSSDEVDLVQKSHILRYGEEFTDFADTAGLVECLDLVISVDSAVAHLAGALGIPVWIMLPYVADWRWLQGRDDSPWYPSARLFRQPSLRAWDPVIDRIERELAHQACARANNEVVE